MAFYGDYVNICEDFAPNFGDKKNRLLQQDNAQSHTSFFARTFLSKTNMTVVPIHRAVLFFRMKIQLKGRHFDTIQVIEAESHAVLNTLIAHDFRMELKLAEALGTVHTLGRGQLRG
jgi:hypothetical protein